MRGSGESVGLKVKMGSRTLTLCTVMSLCLCVLSREVTVNGSNLKLCGGHKLTCVTDPKDCDPRPATSTQKNLNMSCFYEDDFMVTCKWSEDSESHTESKVSLIFSSCTIYSCARLINPLGVFNVTARIKNYRTGRERWSTPHFVDLSKAVMPPPPDLTLIRSSEDSVLVSWTCIFACSCQVRFRDNRTQTWTQAPDFVSTNRKRILNYAIRDLLPYTAYRAAVSCREDSDIWSRWSNEVTARTLERAPSIAPEVCYRLAKTDFGDSFQLHLMWKELDLLQAGGRILGYQVIYEPERRQNLPDRLTQNVTEGTALLVVEAGNCSVTVRAFNAAGFGPAAHLSIDTRGQKTPPAVRNLWASSSSKALLVQWETSKDAPPSLLPVNHFVVLWRSETGTSTTRWTTVDNSSTSTVIRDVDPEDLYQITVFPVYNQQCGPPQSLSASLQRGALVEAVKLKVVGVTKSTVTVTWVWQPRSADLSQTSERVERYSVMLKRGAERQTLSLWPDQSQHTFHNLNPSSEYSLLLLADNSTRSILPVMTDFDEVLVVASVIPLLLMMIVLFIVSVLSRTVYKSYFFPLISSPRGSTTGQWLMDPNHQKPAEGNILDIDDFLVTDVVGKKSLIIVAPNREPTLEKDLREDAALLSIRHLHITLDPVYISDDPVFPDPVLESLQSPYHPVYSVNYPPSDQDYENQEAGSASHTTSSFLQKEEVSRRACEIPGPRETDFRSLFEEFLSNTAGVCVPQTGSEVRCEVNSSSFQGRSDVETNRALICDNDYIANSCFSA